MVTACYDGLVARAATARYVLLGEASHGTDDFYRERAAITRRLIEEAGYAAVAVEGDWPHAHRVDRYVRAASEDATAIQALSDFRRFPAWLWRNTVVAEFVAWLRAFNDGVPAAARRIGFYGLDLYSPRTSMEAVVASLERIDPAAARRARERYACFDHFGRDPRVYAYETGVGGAESCEREVVDQLVELRDRAAALAADSGFHAEQNARLVVNAERYYRAMYRGSVESWNLRDEHMAQTLTELAAHLERTSGRPAKVVVWAHNTHVGDARATDMAELGECNLGQLVRERSREDSLIVGFTTYGGSVTAASDWGAPAQRMRLVPALPESWEALLHERGGDSREPQVVATRELDGARLNRAIGAIYRPETERFSHYVRSRIAEQFDVVVHIDETQALEPLDAYEPPAPPVRTRGSRIP